MKWYFVLATVIAAIIVTAIVTKKMVEKKCEDDCGCNKAVTPPNVVIDQNNLVNPVTQPE